MIRTLSLLACLLLAAPAFAQAEKLELFLKSGESLDGVVKLVDEDGVKLDIGDGIELYIRWSYTRGDRHFELRRGATEFNSIESVLKLADFCHDFAMDQQEYLVLVQVLRLNPTHAEARERLAALPPVAGVEVPSESGPPPASPTTERPTTPRPRDPAPLPPPTREPFKVTLKLANPDAAAETWLNEELAKLHYKIGTARDHEIRIDVDLNLILVRNPRFYGKELFAIYDGTVKWQLFREGEKEPFAQSTEKVEGVRRDTRVQALNSCRTQLLQDALRAFHRELEKQR